MGGEERTGRECGSPPLVQNELGYFESTDCTIDELEKPFVPVCLEAAEFLFVNSPVLTTLSPIN